MFKKRVKRLPTPAEAFIYTILIMGSIVAGIMFNLGTHVSITIGAAIAAIIALGLGSKWDEIQDEVVKSSSKVVMGLLIQVCVGMMVGTWVIGGTISSMVYYGLHLISPTFFLATAFILCSVTSLATGTSWGTIASVGIACLGVGISFGMSEPLIVGAIVSGAYFGDKMSPLSDTTILAASAVETPIMNHVKSMMYTTLPATILCIIIYQVINLTIGSAGSVSDNAVINEVCTTLAQNYKISLITMISPVFVIIASIKKMPTLPVLFCGLIISVATGMILQGAAFGDVAKAMISGAPLDTGVAIVDKLTSRGGATLFYSTVVLILLTTVMSGALNASQVLKVVVNTITKRVKSTMGIFVSTMVTNYLMIAATGSSIISMLLVGKAFSPAFRKLRLDRSVLSRTLEDTGTLALPIIPWTGTALYITATLGVGFEYIPYVFISFLCPVIALILVAVNKFGMTKMPQEEILEAEREEAAEAAALR